jgi:NADPH-dependent curcumin reductase CurA
MPSKSREIHLKSRPVGLPKESDFEIVEVTVPAPGSGQVLVENIWMSVDPSMRIRMRQAGASYRAAFQTDAALDGAAIGQVVDSRSEKFTAGDYVTSTLGWREMFVADDSDLKKLEPVIEPVQAYLGVLGTTGFTAYVGLLRLGVPKKGDTVFVSAAAGAVGGIACQIAKLKACRVVGSVGSDAKASWLKERIGIDEVINYKTCGGLDEALRTACPEGIDIYFDNVGGEHLAAALSHMNNFGRVVMCGMISEINKTGPAPGPSNLALVVGRRLKLEGFIVHDHSDLSARFLKDMSGWVEKGKITWKETVVEGLENAPQAFLKLFSSDSFGKVLVKVRS